MEVVLENGTLISRSLTYEGKPAQVVSITTKAGRVHPVAPSLPSETAKFFITISSFDPESQTQLQVAMYGHDKHPPGTKTWQTFPTVNFAVTSADPSKTGPDLFPVPVASLRLPHPTDPIIAASLSADDTTISDSNAGDDLIIVEDQRVFLGARRVVAITAKKGAVRQRINLVQSLIDTDKTVQMVPEEIVDTDGTIVLKGRRSGTRKPISLATILAIELEDGRIISADKIRLKADRDPKNLSTAPTTQPSEPKAKADINPDFVPPSNRTTTEIEIVRGQARGSRDAQEDRYSYGEVAINEAWQAEGNLREVFEHIDKATSADTTGSTASAAIVTPDSKLTVAHLGDSPVMLFTRDPQTGAFTGRDLIKPHRPSEDPLDPENIRIREAGGVVLYGSPPRVTNAGGTVGALAVSRAFGNAGNLAVSKQPDITSFPLSDLVPAGHEAFLCVATDGLTQGELKTAPEFAELLTQARATSTLEVHRILSHQAVVGRRQSDNVTIQVGKIPHRMTKAFHLNVFDGHGGEGTAQTAQSFFKHYFSQVTPAVRVDLKDQWLQAAFEYGAWGVAKANGVPIIGLSIQDLSAAEIREIGGVLNKNGLNPEWHTSSSAGATFRLTGKENVEKVCDFARSIVRHMKWQVFTFDVIHTGYYVPVNHLNDRALQALNNALQTLNVTTASKKTQIKSHARLGNCLVLRDPEIAGKLKDVLHPPAVITPKPEPIIEAVQPEVDNGPEPVRASFLKKILNRMLNR